MRQGDRRGELVALFYRWSVVRGPLSVVRRLRGCCAIGNVELEDSPRRAVSKLEAAPDREKELFGGGFLGLGGEVEAWGGVGNGGGGGGGEKRPPKRPP